MSRLKVGFTLLVLVPAILVVAPTVVFWRMFGFEAVVLHWAWVVFLMGLMALGIMLVFSGSPARGRPNPRAEEPRMRLRMGIFAFGVVAGVLVLAPTVVFWGLFGPTAVLAHWASVLLLGLMTLGGLYLIFTDKGRRAMPL